MVAAAAARERRELTEKYLDIMTHCEWFWQNWAKCSSLIWLNDALFQ